MDHWRLCDELSVLQAALLVIGEDPSKENAYAENWKLHEGPAGYEAVKTAITKAKFHSVTQRIGGSWFLLTETDRINRLIC